MPSFLFFASSDSEYVTAQILSAQGGRQGESGRERWRERSVTVSWSNGLEESGPCVSRRALAPQEGKLKSDSSLEGLLPKSSLFELWFGLPIFFVMAGRTCELLDHGRGVSVLKRDIWLYLCNAMTDKSS